MAVVIVDGQEQIVEECMLSDVIKAFSINEAIVKVNDLEIPINSKFKIEGKHRVVISTPEFAAIAENKESTETQQDEAFELIKKSAKETYERNDFFKEIPDNVTSIGIFENGFVTILPPRNVRLIKLIFVNKEKGDINIEDFTKERSFKESEG